MVHSFSHSSRKHFTTSLPSELLAPSPSSSFSDDHFCCLLSFDNCGINREFLYMTFSTSFHIFCSLILYFVSNLFNRFIKYLLVREGIEIRHGSCLHRAHSLIGGASSLLEKVNHHSIIEQITSLLLSLVFAQGLELANSLFSFYPPDDRKNLVGHNYSN